jgi:hypothetical protein
VPQVLIDLRPHHNEARQDPDRQVAQAIARERHLFDSIFTIVLDTSIAKSRVVIDTALGDTVQQLVYEFEIVTDVCADRALAADGLRIRIVIERIDDLDPAPDLADQTLDRTASIWFKP